MTSRAYDLKESALKGTHDGIRTYEELASWLVDEIDGAQSARSGLEEQLRYWWTYYEQGRTREANAPWPDAADLTSPMATEYVDALHARVMQTIFTDPVWTVEGWGPSAANAPFVEEFHQRAVEDERFQTYCDQWLMRAWVEPAGILEISEAVEWRLTRQTKRIALQLGPDGGMLLDADNQPVYAVDQSGEYVEAQTPEQPSAEVEMDVWEPVRTGPAYDVVPYLDFLTLPAHARSHQQIWGYAKRFYRRVPELTWRAEKGIYDKRAVASLGEQDERDQSERYDVPRPTEVVAEQRGPTAQKELYEVQFLANLDGQGERWYRATLHKDRRALLRLKFDDRTTRYFRAVPFPRPGSIDGYSLIGHKLITTIEEDTALRNMRADRSALAVAMPIKRLTGALWDPYEQPMGPRSVIDVRDMRELEPMAMPDVPASLMIWKQDVRNDADRLVGQNDTSLGQEAGRDATLGEVRLRAGYAEVRTDLIIKRLKEPMEELGQARHAIWKRALAAHASGMPMPSSMVIGLEARGVDVERFHGTIRAEMLEGRYWFKPAGSVESADLDRLQLRFVQFMQVLPGLIAANPALASIFQTPQAAKALLEQMLRVFRWQDKQAFLGPEAQAALEQSLAMQQMMRDPRMRALLAAMGGGPPQGAAPQGPPQAPQPGPEGGGLGSVQ